MQKEKKSLEELIKELKIIGNFPAEDIEELKSLIEQRDFYESELVKKDCEGNRARYYTSKIDLYNFLVEKTQEKLDFYFQKLKFSLGNIWGSSISRFIKGYGKLMSEAKEKFEVYSRELEEFNQKYNPVKDKK